MVTTHKIKVKDIEYDLQDKDAALVEAILVLANEIRKASHG